MRQLSPYEQNHLHRHGVDPETIEKYGDMPVEYITGFAEFYGREFAVNPHVMIPRVETEGLIDLVIKGASRRQATGLRPEVLRPRGDKRQVSRFADLGTGSGCIGITLYAELEARGMKPEAYLSDISEEAIRVAKQNVERLVPKPHRIHLLQSNLLNDYEPSNHRPHSQFDLIVANLPYIPSGRIASLPESVRDYEPHLALDGGPDGLSVIRKFITQAPQYLKKNGFIIVEVDESHQPTQANLPTDFSASVQKDQFEKDRFWILHA